MCGNGNECAIQHTCKITIENPKNMRIAFCF
jgi:diaminopimelate epimerase